MSWPHRRRRGYSSFYEQTPTTISITWSTKAGAYAIHFSDTHHWEKMKSLIEWLKKIPYGENRDYDDVNKIWYVDKKYIDDFKLIASAYTTEFKIDFQEKPEGEVYQHNYISNDTLFHTFKELTNYDMAVISSDTAGYKQAKHIYRNFCKNHHPDINPGDSALMSRLNECWSLLEIQYFKVKQVNQLQEV